MLCLQNIHNIFKTNFKGQIITDSNLNPLVKLLFCLLIKASLQSYQIAILVTKKLGITFREFSDIKWQYKLYYKTKLPLYMPQKEMNDEIYVALLSSLLGFISCLLYKSLSFTKLEKCKYHR